MKQLQLVLFCLFSCVESYACNGGTFSGALTPNAAYQTVATQNGRYYTVNVMNCTQYEFTFCAGGSSSGFDTQLTVLDNAGTTELVYSDDVCGTNASIIWTATFTGTIRILVSRYNCNHDLTSNVTMAYRMTSGSGGNCFTLGGNASNIVVGGQNCVQLTSETNNQTGCAWNGSVVDFNTAFTLSLNAYFGNNIDGADGTAYVFQPNPSSGCGQIGGQLGAGGISNALIIEFDTYNNDFPAQIFDLPYDHVAIETDGNLLGPGAPYCGPVAARPGNANLDDGNMHVISISWFPGTQTLSVFVDGNLRLSCSGNFVSTVFGGDNTVYWGASASTGGLNNQQYFCSSAIVLPVELISFSSDCENETEQLKWTVEEEVRLKEYVVEMTYDMNLFYPIETVLPKGENQPGATYQITVKDGSDQQAYYRLKMVDDDGNFKYSDLISSKKCGSNNGLPALASYLTTGGMLNLYFTDNYEVEVYDMSGKLIYSGDTGTSNMIKLSQPTAGMYLIRTMGEKVNSTYATQRIYVD